MSRWHSRGPVLVNDEGLTLSRETAQEMIQSSVERRGKFIMGSEVQPVVGDIGYFAGLPMRVVRLVSLAEAEQDWRATEDIWGPHSGQELDASHFFFEVEVAD